MYMSSIQVFDKLVMQVKLFNHYIYFLPTICIYTQSTQKPCPSKKGIHMKIKILN